jgi:hypothetical protein
MMNEYLILYILFCHFVADFVFQTRWMGTNKSSNPLAMGAHIFTYFAVMSVALAIGYPFFMEDPPAFAIRIAYAGTNAGLHFLTDYVTSNITTFAFKNERMHLFWSVIGLDQFLHAAALILTAGAFIA